MMANLAKLISLILLAGIAYGEQGPVLNESQRTIESTVFTVQEVVVGEDVLLTSVLSVNGAALYPGSAHGYYWTILHANNTQYIVIGSVHGGFDRIYVMNELGALQMAPDDTIKKLLPFLKNHLAIWNNSGVQNDN